MSIYNISKLVYDIISFYLQNHEYVLYKSKNMLDWKPIQHIDLPENGECPDFFPLAADNDSDNIKWVLIGTSDRYLIGSFDGEQFTAENEMMHLRIPQTVSAFILQN